MGEGVFARYAVRRKPRGDVSSDPVAFGDELYDFVLGGQRVPAVAQAFAFAATALCVGDRLVKEGRGTLTRRQ